MFQFIYHGRFNCLITKDTFETYLKDMYANMKKLFNITWSPAKFVVTMEMDPTRPRGIGGNTDFDRKTDIIFRLRLQLFGFPKKDQTFELMQEMFEHILRHEMFHFLVPSVQDNSCWTEGVVEFMTNLYRQHGSQKTNLESSLYRLTQTYNETIDVVYKEHLYGYVNGFKKMLKLFNEDPNILDDIRKIIQDFNKTDDTYKRPYSAADIIAYNPKFKIFFRGRCNKHVVHEFE